MPLAPGTQLGPYEITAPLGAGGMGEVYRARDTRLDRDVAVKVLPANLSSEPSLRQRLEREAKAVSKLSHPHICTLHDVGHQDGVDFLVMELVEGETLERRLVKGPLPPEQTIRIAAQIAEALAEAHKLGIVHRDLKPANVMLTKTGAKLMDFGLAKHSESAPLAAALAEMTLDQAKLTGEGTIIGTFQYMAPEQLEGKEADARTDLFALGEVIYEMATGKPAFTGKSRASLIAAILSSEPQPMAALQPMTPPALERVVKKCLAKDPDERWQSASDLACELSWIAEGGPQVTLASAGAWKGIRVRWQRALLLGVASLILAAITGLAVWRLKPSLPEPVSRTVITLPPGQRLAGLDQPALALSPDGSLLAYVAMQGGTQQLYLRAMNSFESRPISGTDGATNPFFSPDGQWLGFFADHKLKKVPVSGGAVLTLGDAVQPRGASWGSQGTIALARTINGALQQVPEGGGSPQQLTRLEKGETSERWPEFLPGGKAVLFTAAPSNASWTHAHIAVQEVGTGARSKLIQGAATNARYAPSGHVVYAQGATLMAVPFDPQRLVAIGPAAPAVDGVLQSSSSGAAQYSFSSTGSLVYVSGGVQSAQRRLVWVNRNGTEQPVPARQHSYLFPRLSPNGGQVAVAIVEQDPQNWLYDLARGTLTRLTFEGKFNNDPIWTPDGKWIAFQSVREGPVNLFWQRADGSGGLERLTTSEYSQGPMSWSPDGQLLAFVEIDPTTGYDIWVLRMGDRKPQPFLRTPFDESAPQFSPDGHWLAYISNESGPWEVYVQPYPGPGGKWQISTEGGTEPVWNRNGRELFYRSGDKMMAVDVDTQPSFAAGKPRVLFEGRYEPTPATFPNYDVSPDGQRFLMLKPSEAGEAAPTQINVVLNWFEELKRRVPTGKNP